MKSLIIISALAFCSFGLAAQTVKEAEVPAATKSALIKIYPSAKVEKWEKEEGNYEAEFHNNKIETSVLISEGGTILETETEMKPDDLPKSIAEYVNKYLNGKKIKEASKIVYQKGKIGYEAEVDDIDYIFDENGTFVEKKAETDKDTDNNK
ncbi:MAG: hypothetical protein K0Q95_270 [Bacteroidota bacterium]|jgi:hypothetical protein|nr:hypothetical protein [Bacteroidota bacterium]